MNYEEIKAGMNTLPTDDIEVGEEDLYKVYDFKNKKGKEIVLACVDAGSTQTRVLIWDKKSKETDKYYVIPSVNSYIIDNRDITPKSPALYDNLDSSITDLATPPTEKGLFDKVRVIRGTKFKDTIAPENKIDSTGQKIDSETFYINIVDAIGYALSQHYGNAIPTDVEVILGVALPPDDLQSTLNQEKFRSRILRAYKWSLIGKKVDITIDIRAVEMLTEPEALSIAYRLTQCVDEEPADLHVHIDCGGRSTGIELFKRGRRIDSASRTLNVGGSQLIDSIKNLYVTKYGGKPLKTPNVRKALRTGFVKARTGTVEIVNNIITPCKQNLAKIIYNGLKEEVFNNLLQIDLTEVDLVTVSGKTFGEGEYGVSVAAFLEALFREAVPSIEFEYIEHNYIPLGLMFNLFEDYLGYIEDDEDEDTEEEENTEE